MSEDVPKPTEPASPDAKSGDEFFSSVYDELRRLAAAKLARERRGHSLQATALVNEAYLRLQQAPDAHRWENRRHFFTAAADAMRRILVDSARHKNLRNRDLAERAGEAAKVETSLDDVLDVHDGLDQLSAHNAEAGEIVKLHYFAGLSIDEAAELLGMNRRRAFRLWNYARAWLYRRLRTECDAKETQASNE